MTASVTSTTSSTTSTSTSAKSSGLSANYDTFLKLLCAQLKNQNPLSPTDATQFTSQLVQYSNLEQQVKTNSKLDSVLSSLSASSFTNGASYIGCVVEAAGNSVNVKSDGTVSASWNYELDSKASSVKLSVTDSAGKVVWTGSGDPAVGTHALVWNGTDSSGKAFPAGDYTLKVTALDASGAAIETSTTIKGKVTAVSSNGGNTMLELGGTNVKLSDITRLAA
ncbi:flagellar hook assembly protein FlgD [Magnetospirillum molischianum]|uniref:Basal-body rod modification protein FlgD n=1 Tax=Magnetospirillum molischianum DSM 120 TaxID=1150626 RepID=H8FWC2_MAGML|nr:flagellar hook assembly protein FlgD [Magnetospirillum molischianum]CCG42660.1 Basal-body rod modification protein flgD [Magnetospirillum molischianum DSM 120]